MLLNFCPRRSTFHSGALSPLMDFFCHQLVQAAHSEVCRCLHPSRDLPSTLILLCAQQYRSAITTRTPLMSMQAPPFQHFIIRGMLFLNATLRSSNFRGAPPANFKLSAAAQEQVSLCCASLLKCSM